MYSLFTIYQFHIKKIDMSIREVFENRERAFMSPAGCLSSESRGRAREEKPCPIRTAFQVDRDRILYSTAFRRLKHKTQVFLSPMGDVYRTRLTHTLEVAQIARTITRAFRLNEDLAEAIALGHDLGHPPFGHSGETCLKEIFSETFSHNKQGVRIVDLLERNGSGLNLTYEVRDGILKHSKGYGEIMPDDPEASACTVEGKIVRLADIMAYLNHDLDDAIKSGIIREDHVPESCTRIIGHTHSKRAITLIRDLVFSSRVSDDGIRLHMSSEICCAMSELRQFLYDNVYRSPRVHKEFVKAKKILFELYTFFLENEKELGENLKRMELPLMDDCDRPLDRMVCDLIASMTDRHALDLYRKLFFPSPLV